MLWSLAGQVSLVSSLLVSYLHSKEAQEKLDGTLFQNPVRLSKPGKTLEPQLPLLLVVLVKTNNVIFLTLEGLIISKL